MKILYGVQATGNGHITRARAMNKWFSKYNIDVDFVFSGRPKSELWDMEEFGDWRYYTGLSFVHEAGNIKYLETIKQNRPWQFLKDIHSLNLDPYDLIITDYEPISAWAAKRRRKLCIGVGHQYAFGYDVPKEGDDFAASLIMKSFAPVKLGLGLHWHHFGAPILPPIAETHDTGEPSDPNKVVVYLGFEDPERVIELLEPFEDYLFTYYAPFPQYESRGHIQLKPLSREGFKHDLATAGGVICNAGFELSSEAIQLGKKLLVKPLIGQMEQQSNAKALLSLGLGSCMTTLDHDSVARWLEQPGGNSVVYPDVAKAIVAWLAKGNWLDQHELNAMIVDLWSQTDANGLRSFSAAPAPQLS